MGGIGPEVHVARFSLRLHRSFRVALVALAIAIVPAVPATSSQDQEGGSFQTQNDYEADFSEASSRGVGVRFAHLLSGRYVDLRLKGYRGAEPQRRGRRAEFAPARGIRVVYEPERASVKETIILEQPSPDEFRFQLKAPGLTARQEHGLIFFEARESPMLFRLRPVEAWDAGRVPIPGTLALEGEEVVLRLDPPALAAARPPITIDPTIEGVEAGQTDGPHARRLFETSDGRLIFFYRERAGAGTRVVYRVSSDRGQTWAPAAVVAPDAGIFGDVAVAQGSDDSFFVVYSSGPLFTGDSEAPYLALRRLTRRPDGGWDVGPEVVAAPGPVLVTPHPSIADRGAGPLGRRLAIGFARRDPVLNRYEYDVVFSEDSGATWTPRVVCDSDTVTPFGTVAAAGERALCVTGRFWQAGLAWREWTGALWAPPRTIPVGYTWDPPSTTVGADGTLHLVVGAGPGSVWEPFQVYYASLASGAPDWSAPQILGPGAAPVIATTGTSLHAYAAERFSSRESWIRQYVAPDGVTWAPGIPLSGLPFAYVLDYNAAWGFEDLPALGDVLFALTDGAGTVGNRVGTTSAPHRLDRADKALSFSFVAGTAGAVSTIKWWYTATENAPLMEFGIQEDDGSGNPSGVWLAAQGQAGVSASASWSAVRASVWASVSLSIPQAQLTSGRRYHVVLRPAPGSIPGPTSWVEIQAVGAEAGAEGSLRVLDRAAGLWTAASGQVPRFALSGPGGILVAQEIAPAAPQPATEYSVPGEAFVARRDLSPTDVRVYLTKVGDPGGTATLRILDAAGTELWSAEATPTQSGWVSLPAAGLNLVSGSTYRLLADSRNTDGVNYWALGASGDGTVSWDGVASALTKAFDRPGFNDRTIEADDRRTAPVDFVAFNSSAADALYLGGLDPFSFASLTRLAGDAGRTLGTAWSYWNGSDWSPFTMTRNDFGGSSGESEFPLPADWVRSQMDGRDAYWVRVASTAGAPTPVFVERTSSIPNFASPTAAPRAQDDIPLAFASYSGGGATVQTTAAPIGPTLFLDGRGDWALEAQELTSDLSWQAVDGLSLTTPIRQGSTHFVRGIAGGVATRIGGGTPYGTVKVLQGTRVECTRSDQPLVPIIPFGENSGENKGTQNNLNQTLAPETFFLFEGGATTTVRCTLYALAEDVQYGSSASPGTDQPTSCNAGPPSCDANTIRLTSGFLFVSGLPQLDAKETPIGPQLFVSGEEREIARISDWQPLRPLREIKLGVEVTNCHSSNDPCPLPYSSTANANVRLTVTATSSNCSVSRNTGTVQISAAQHHRKIVLDVGPPDFTALATCTPPITLIAYLRVADSSNPVEIEDATRGNAGWATLVARSCIAPTVTVVPIVSVMCSGT